MSAILVRYTNQKDQFRCGPVAIANAMKWAGVDFSFRDNKKKLDKLVNIKKTGCNSTDITTALRAVGEKYLTGIQRRKLNDYTPTQAVRMIRKHIRSGGIALMNIRRYSALGEKEGHFYLIVDRYVDENDEFFICVNAFDKSLLGPMHEKYLRDDLRCAQNETHSVWLLKRREPECCKWYHRWT